MRFTSHYSSSSGNLYLLKSGDHSLLIEAGVPIKKIRDAVNISGLDGCLCTHRDGDHSKAVPDLLKRAVDCWMSQETADSLRVAAHHRCHIIEKTHQGPPSPPYSPFEIAGQWKVYAFPTEHCEGSVAFLVSDGTERLLFLIDTAFFRYKLRGINILAIECNWATDTLAPNLDPVVKKRLLTSHFSLAHVLKFLDANDLSRCREIHLIHLSDGNSDERMFVDKVKAATGIPVYAARA